MRGRTPLRHGVVLLTTLGCLATLAACGGESTPAVLKSQALDGLGATVSPVTEFGVPTPDSSEAFRWRSVTSDPAGPGDVEVGLLAVPMEYDNPSVGEFELYVARRRANDPERRIGSVLVNPGGPGFGGSDLALYAEQYFSSTLLDHFDIVGWDPRGTGDSTPAIDCVDDYDRYYAGTDITPDDAAERQQLVDLAREYQEACAANNADIVRHVGTNNSARDMNAIREALGEATISYFGFSYGSELGATWATLFPDTVRAAVLDGAADPAADYTASGVQQSAGFEASLTTFLARCSGDPDCAFHSAGDAEGAFDALMLAIDEQPLPTVEGRPALTRSMALTAVNTSMYTEARWPALAQALAAAQAGSGAALLTQYDEYNQRRADGTYDNSLEAFQTIFCMDRTERLTVEEDDALATEYLSVAPRTSPGTTGSYFCSFYPASTDPRLAITGAGAGPILVVGTTGDPATPLSSTEAMAAALERGVLVVVEGDQHTGYGINQCSFEVVDSYLVNLAIPPPGYRCD